MAEDEAKSLLDAKQLPFADRVAHKNWKVRSEAYDDIKASCQSVFSEEDPVLSQYCKTWLLHTVQSSACTIQARSHHGTQVAYLSRA